MITEITIKNFRQIKQQTIELKPITVLVGPNNSGKTSLLQAFSLLAMAIKVWGGKRLDNPTKKQLRTGIAINIDDLASIPITEFKELWTNTKTRQGSPDKKGTTPIKIEIYAKGFAIEQNQTERKWEVGFEFNYQRDSLIYTKLIDRYNFKDILMGEKIGFLPSIVGLNPKEDKLELGSIFRYIGEGRTADVLRNICYHLYVNDKEGWKNFTERIKNLFSITLDKPRYFAGSGLLELTYSEANNKKMALASLGSGAKQAILLFAYLGAFKNTINLLDEPDAHLEVIKQADVYGGLSDFAKRNNSQIIIASHSESVLNNAKDDLLISSMSGEFRKEHRDTIKPFLKHYGFEQYLAAKQRPFILYYEGATDLEFIRAFCEKLNRKNYLKQLNDKIYPYAINGNGIRTVKQHFKALKEFLPQLKGFALFDNLDRDFQDIPTDLKMYQWQRQEIENYIPIPKTLVNYVKGLEKQDLFTQIHPKRLTNILRDRIPPIAYEDLEHDFWLTTKISTFLSMIFEDFLTQTQQPLGTMDKSKFYLLIEYMDKKQLNSEVTQVIDDIFSHLK